MVTQASRVKYFGIHIDRRGTWTTQLKTGNLTWLMHKNSGFTGALWYMRNESTHKWKKPAETAKSFESFSEDFMLPNKSNAPSKKAFASD